MGIPDEELVDPGSIGEESRCPICMQVLQDPVEGTCEHLFCRGCIGPVLGKKPQCPVCRAELAPDVLRVAHRYVRAALDKVEVRCTRWPECAWTGRLDQRLGHSCLPARAEHLIKSLQERDERIQKLKRALKDRDAKVAVREEEVARIRAESNAKIAELERALKDRDGKLVEFARTRAERAQAAVKEREILREMARYPDSSERLQAGKRYCLIDRSCYAEWYLDATTQTTEHSGRKRRRIDNRSLFDDKDPCRLKQHLLEHKHYEVLSQEAWALLQGQCQGGPPIERKAISTPDGEVVLDVYAEIDLRVYKSSAPGVVQITFRESRYTTLDALKRRACDVLDLDPYEVRLWDFWGQEKYRNLEGKILRTLEHRDIGLVDGNAILLEEMAADGTWEDGAWEF